MFLRPAPASLSNRGVERRVAFAALREGVCIPKRVARVIQFYRIEFILKDASSGRVREVDPRPLFQSVAAMPSSQYPPGRYLTFADGNALAMEGWLPPSSSARMEVADGTLTVTLGPHMRRSA